MKLPLALLAAGLLGCADPVADARIDALGDEVAGVAEGPLHRAGQPCLLCHDDGRARRFSVAGTLYATPEGQVAAPGVVVVLTDARGSSHRVASNCAGNFFVAPSDFEPTYPLWVGLEHEDYSIAMDSPVRRDGSCASCHTPSKGPDSAGPVYLASAPRPNTVQCP